MSAMNNVPDAAATLEPRFGAFRTTWADTLRRLADNKLAYSVAFDLRSEEFVVCSSDAECEMYWEVAKASGCEEEVFWSE